MKQQTETLSVKFKNDQKRSLEKVVRIKRRFDKEENRHNYMHTAIMDRVNTDLLLANEE